MEYVEHLDLFGQEVKEIPCITGKNPPSASTVGKVGMFYMDTETGEVYKCVAASANTYTWKNLSESTSGIDAALDELHAYAQALVNGGAS